MSGVYIKGMEMPTSCSVCELCGLYAEHKGDVHRCDITMYVVDYEVGLEKRRDNCPLIPIPEHGRLIDADALRAKMYHEAFETDTPMQKWDSGCWIRYKLFEMTEESAPTIIPAEEGE